MEFQYSKVDCEKAPTMGPTHNSLRQIYVPVTLNSFAVIEKAFHDSYLTQVKAEFPSPYFDDGRELIRDDGRTNQESQYRLNHYGIRLHPF